MNWFKRSYFEEKDENQMEPNVLEASYIEIALCYLSIFIGIAFSLYALFSSYWSGFEWKHLLLLFAPIFWIFLRISRKDMHATALLIGGSAGVAGAIAGLLLRH